MPQNYTTQIIGQLGDHQTFRDSIINDMPKLIANGLVSLSPYGLMVRRLAVLEVYKPQFYAFSGSSDPTVNYWWNNRFDTDWGVARHPDGRAKLVPNALRDITPKSELSHGDLVLPDGLYEKLRGFELSAREVNRYRELQRYMGKYRGFTRDEAKNDLVWWFLARRSSVFQKTYIDAVLDILNETSSLDRGMLISFDPAPDVPVLSMISVEGINQSSNITIGRSLDSINQGAYSKLLVGLSEKTISSQKSVNGPNLATGSNLEQLLN